MAEKSKTTTKAAAARSGDAAKLREACARGELKTVRALLERGAGVNAADEKGKTPLYFAAKRGNVDVLKLLLEQGAKLDAVTKTKRSVLHEAALKGGLKATKFLVEHGAAVDAVDEDGDSVLSDAAANGDVELLKFLLQHGAPLDATNNDRETALFAAAEAGNDDAVAFLVKQGLKIDDMNEDGESVFHAAARGDEVETMRLLLTQGGVDVHAKTEDGRTALHIAADAGSDDAVRFLVKHGLQVDVQDEDGNTPFHAAAGEGEVDTMKLLLKLGANKDAITKNGRNALHFAASSGDEDAVKFLVKKGLRADAIDENGETVLHLAAGAGDLSIVQLLIKHGADAHAVTQAGRNALFYAADEGHSDIVQFLVKKGVAVDVPDEDGETVFQIAASEGDVSVLQFLMKHGADPHAVANNGRTALHVAAVEGHDAAVEFLVKQGLNVAAIEEDGESPFIYAALGGNVSMMKLLIKHGADVHALVGHGQTALHYAAGHGYPDAVRFLVVDQGLSVDAVDANGESAFHRAAKEGHVDVLRQLLKLGANPKATTKHGNDALHVAASGGRATVVRFLVDEGLDANATNNNGETAFHAAATEGAVDVLQQLIKAGTDIHAVTSDGRNALHCAAARGHARAAEFLLAQGVSQAGRGDVKTAAKNLCDACSRGDLDAVRTLLMLDGVATYSNEKRKTPLYFAAKRGDVQVIKLLVEHGADVNALTKTRLSILHEAAEKGSVDAVQYLLEHGAAADAIDEDGDSVFHFAAISGDVEKLRLLIKHGADAHAAMSDGRNALHCAARSGRPDAVRFLLELGLPIDSVDEDGDPVFHHAAVGGDVGTLQLLLTKGADAFALNGEGQSALYCAAADGRAEAVQFLARQGLDVNLVEIDGETAVHAAAREGAVNVLQLLQTLGADMHATTKDGRNALHIAAADGNAAAVRFLVEQGLDVNCADSDGTTVLHAAASDGDVSIMQLLVKHGAGVHATSSDGRSALHYAASEGGSDAVRFLVKQGIKVDTVDEDGESVFHLAAVEEDVSILQLLQTLGADAHATTKDGRTALHFAARGGYATVVRFLVEQGLDVNASSNDGWTAVHEAASEGNVDALQLLLALGADVHATTEDGRNALQYAAAQGHAEAVDFLVREGLSIQTTQADGESAIHEAARQGDSRTMQLLIDHGADIHALGENAWTLLHYSADAGQVDMVKFLLEQGLPVNATGADGESPFHLASQEGDIETMRVLCEHGAAIHAVSQRGKTALHYGACSGKFFTVKFLLDLGLAIDATAQDGSTALHKAAKYGDVGTVQLLVDHGADVLARTNNGRSALHYCAKGEKPPMARFLVEAGVPLDATDGENGCTALHVAASTGNIVMMRALVALGPAIHAQTKTSRTLLHLAIEGQHLEVLQYALTLGMDVTTRAQIDGAGATPLMLAFQAGDSKAAYAAALALCAHGASVSSEDRATVLLPTHSSKAPSGTDNKDPAESELWRTGLLACVDHWTEQQHAAGDATLTNVPIEVVNRGEASVKTYLDDMLRSKGEDGFHRCKICVVGPSKWGKTSLVQSLQTNQTFLTKLEDRTIGIDLTTWLLKTIVDESPVQLEITFWDFAGQDVYQAAHTLFFSARTLFVLVVDLDAYWSELADASGKSDRESEAQMNRFAGAKIFRWVRSIFAHQPDAQFVVVGTKVNCLEDARVVAEIWDDLRDRLDHWKKAFAKGLDRELVPAGATAKDIKALQARLHKLASSDWLVANVMDLDSLKGVGSAIETTITSSELGFPMWRTYTQVLQSVVRRRDAAQNATSVKDRIEKSIVRFSNLRRQLLREIEQLDRDACEQIVRTLNDLGDVLWYEHDGAGVFKDCIILDPMLVIEVVREVVRHDFSSNNHVDAPRDGRIPHALLRTFPMWKDMDVELMHAFKALLQHFQLAYPADADEMLPESDIIVPAYWNAEDTHPQPTQEDSGAKPPSPQSVCDAFAAHRWCWEYEIPSELSETIFVQFAVQSHSSYLPRTIQGHCVEAACAEFASRIALIQRESSRDVLRIEVSSESAEMGWHNMRFYLMKMEKVLEGYGGDVIWRFIVDRPAGDKPSSSRHAVGALMKAIEDAIAMGTGAESVRDKMPWMPPDMDWFLRKAWDDVATLQQLRMNHLVEEKLEVLRKLAIAGDTPRQFPALWSLEYVPEKQKAVLRMSSDLSGRCYHVPIEIDTGSPLLARHAGILKTGVSLFANVVGNAVSLPILQRVVDAAKSALDNNADNAVRVHSLIEKLDLSSASSSSQPFDARTNNSSLSPGASMVLLRDLLKAYNDSLDALEISEISNLECAVTSRGEFVWAHAHEIAALGDKITRCSAPPSTWKDHGSSHEDASVEDVSASPPLDKPSSSTSSASLRQSAQGKDVKSQAFQFTLCVDAIEGLSDWDWHKTYCKWQLYHGNKSLPSLASDVTPTNPDSSVAPSWRSMRVAVDAVASVEMLRECRLAVQVKRRSRIGWTKLIGEGHAWLRDFVDKDASQNFACDPVRVPLDSTTERAAVVHLAA